jgi:hypothetical protein
LIVQLGHFDRQGIEWLALFRAHELLTLKPANEQPANTRETQEVDEKGVSISEKQKFNKDLTMIRKWVEKGEKPELKEITGESITVKSMWAQFDQLTIIDDVLVRQLEGLKTKLQVLVPMTIAKHSVHLV